MSDELMLARYLEAGQKMRLWVARGHPERAAELFKSMPDALQQFRSFKKVRQAITEDPDGLHGKLEKMFDVSRLIELANYNQPWKRRKREERFGVRG